MGRFASGSGPGVITDDGCSVDLYARLSHRGEADLIASVAAPGGSVLDLGAGAGRIAHPLMRLGYKVTAVDQSAEMLAHIDGAETVQSSVEALDLGSRTFDVVLLSAYLLNTPGAAARRAMLDVCRRYLGFGGVFIGQVRSASILTNRLGRTHESGDVRSTVSAWERTGSCVTMTVDMESRGDTWRQTFTHEHLDQATLAAELSASGICFREWIDAAPEWFVADPVVTTGADFF
jgi:ubiquinone/menaquinone biosynthesis C-methylase UbiE